MVLAFIYFGCAPSGELGTSQKQSVTTDNNPGGGTLPVANNPGGSGGTTGGATGGTTGGTTGGATGGTTGGTTGETTGGTTADALAAAALVLENANANAGIIDLNSTQEQRIALEDGCHQMSYFENAIETKSLFGANSYDGSYTGKYADFYLQKVEGAFVVTKIIVAGWPEQYGNKRDPRTGGGTKCHWSDTFIPYYVCEPIDYEQTGHAYSISYTARFQIGEAVLEDIGLDYSDVDPRLMGDEPMGRLSYIGKVSRQRGLEQARDVDIHQLNIPANERIKIPSSTNTNALYNTLANVYLSINPKYNQASWHAKRGELNLMSRDADALEQQALGEVRQGQNRDAVNTANGYCIFSKEIKIK